MGRQDVMNVLKKNRKWMSNRDIKEHLNINTSSIRRVTEKLYYDFPDIIEKKIVRTTSHEVFYYRYKRK